MKKLGLILIFVAAVSFANAQVNKTTTTKANKTMNQPSANMNKVMIKTSELKKAITDNITKDYPDYMVMDAYKLTNDKTAAYEIIVEKGNLKENLYYTEDGVFVRKETSMEQPKTNMMPKKAVQKSSTTKQTLKKSY